MVMDRVMILRGHGDANGKVTMIIYDDDGDDDGW